MAKLRWVVPCLVASIDRFTNAITLTHVLEEIGVPEDSTEPTILERPVLIQPGFAVASLWERSDLEEPEKLQARLTVLAPSGKKLAGTEVSIDLTGSRRARNISRFGHFPFVGPGVYAFHVHFRADESAKWKRAGESTLYVKRMPAEQTQQKH